MIVFIDTHRGAYGVEPICRVLPIAPSTYHEHAARRADLSRLPPRAKRDAELRREVQRVFEGNLGVYGVRKVWHQLRREGLTVARCTVARPMRGMGLAGVTRGKPARTTASDKAAPCPLIASTANSEYRPRTCCGSQTSPMSRHGRASSTWPSSLTHMRGASSAGG